MADSATTTTMSRWHMLCARREELVHKIEARPDDLEVLEQQLAATEEALLLEPAPDAAATLFKLEILWDGHHGDDDDEARCKQLILTELRGALA